MELLHLPGVAPRDVVLIDKPMSPQLAEQIRTEEAWLLPMTQRARPETMVPGFQAQESVPFLLNRQWPAAWSFRATRLRRLPPAVSPSTQPVG